MKTNISSLMNLISGVEKHFNNVNLNIKSLAVNTSIEELDGRVNVIEDNKEEFELKIIELEESISDLSKLKSLLYEKNNLFRLKDGRTIQTAIVENTYLRKLKATYEQMLLLCKNSKKRVTEVNNSYFECREINFDVEELRKKVEELNEKIQDTDFEISKLNSTEFKI